MRKRTVRWAGIMATAMATLAGCGPRELALRDDPIDRAATCAVVSAAEARAQAPGQTGDLDFGSQMRILHHAMLAASTGESFSSKTASDVVARMGEVEAEITGGKWQELVGPCDEAFPEVKKTEGIELPAARFDAALGCYALGDFLVKTVSTNDADARARLDTVMAMKRALDGPVGNGLNARGASDYERTLALKQAALVRMTRAGAPAETIRLCTSRFG